jgi:hypothetical protein
MTANGPRAHAGQPTTGPRRTAGGGAAIPDDPQELAEDIKLTRQQVGDTVEALTTKLDPKAQLRDTAGRMKTRVSAVTGQVAGKITDKAGPAGQRLRGTAAKAARGADEQRVPLAVAAGVAALLLGTWMTWVMRRR